MMLEYLFPSAARRRLLSLLWVEQRSGSVAELASATGIAISNAHTELKAMAQVQLVHSDRTGRSEVFFANPKHPQADALRALLSGSAPVKEADEETKRLKRQLKALGLPLAGVAALAVSADEVLPTLVKALALARQDPTVARNLPLCFWQQRELFTTNALAKLRLQPEEKHALGFYLELTCRLGKAPKLEWLAETLRDKRLTGSRSFFLGKPKTLSGPVFELAEKWGFAMSMNMDSFRSAFSKFA